MRPLKLLKVITRLNTGILRVTISNTLMTLGIMTGRLLSRLRTIMGTTKIANGHNRRLGLKDYRISFLTLSRGLIAQSISGRIAGIRRLSNQLINLINTARRNTCTHSRLTQQRQLSRMIINARLRTSGAVLSLTLNHRRGSKSVQNITGNTTGTLTKGLERRRIRRSRVRLVLLRLLSDKLTITRTRGPVTLTLRVNDSDIASYLLVLSRRGLFYV